MGCFGVIAELLSLLLFIGAIVTNSFLLLSCDLWKVESLLFDGSLGLFSWQVPGQNQECTEIASSEEKDFYEGEILLCARWSAVAALSLGVLMTLLLLFKQYLIPIPCTALLRDMCAIGVQICLGLVYATYFSKLCTDFECHYGQGTLLLIVTQSLWAVGGVLSLCMRPGRYERSEAAAEESSKPQNQPTADNNNNNSNNNNNNNNAEDVEEARDTFNEGESGLEAGLAKYQDDGKDGEMSETSSMAVGMSVNPEDDKPDGKLEQSTGLATQQEEEEEQQQQQEKDSALS